MANNCFIDIKIETETAEQAEGLRMELQAAFKEAYRKNLGAFFGCETRYLFDATVEQTGTELIIGGWVKWGYLDEEFVDMFNWLRKKVAIKKLNMRYEELGCDLYGEYDFDGEEARRYFLEHLDFPMCTEDDDEYSDDYHEKLEAAYQKNRVTISIPID